MTNLDQFVICADRDESLWLRCYECLQDMPMDTCNDLTSVVHLAELHVCFHPVELIEAMGRGPLIAHHDSDLAVFPPCDGDGPSSLVVDTPKETT